MTPEPRALLDLALVAAREAGALLLERFSAPATGVDAKSSPTDMVSDADRDAEALIVRRILEARPGDAILGEETGERPGTSGVRWIIDPLDGTTNFLYGRPAFAVSIAAVYEHETLAGAVHDVTAGVTYSATTGGGAHLDGRPIAVSGHDDLATALTGTGFSYARATRSLQAEVLARVLPAVRDLRRGGSACLDLCAVACGQLDAFFEAGLQPWDRAAGLLIVREAGGAASVIPGSEALPETVVAASPALLESLLALLRAG